ncbi:hypothetical protein [Sphingomonas daechungensis]|uniref:hypothetical protein n=1 Tax=Sphingomonas daechungensis TaxID=1176646 RepID=UPI00378514AA
MRAVLVVLPLALLATPALAAPPADHDVSKIQRELADPKWADRLTDTMIAVSRAFLNMPVGEVEAAVQGRQPTAADKRRTMQSETGMSEQQLQQKIEDTRPKIEAGMRAMAAALPAIVKGFSDAQREIERASANVPRPDYPRR